MTRHNGSSPTKRNEKGRITNSSSTVGGSWWEEDGFWYGLHTLFDPARVPFFRTAIQTHALDSPQVLDVGSGGGFVAMGLGDIARVTPVDHSFDVAVAAQAAGVPRVVVAEAAQLPFGASTFDAVVCSEVLEHVPDPGAVIAEAARLVAPGGLFLFSTPARTMWSRIALIDAAQRWRLTRVLPSDLHDWDDFLTRDELVDLLEQNGFRLRRIAGMGVRFRSWPGMLLALMLLKMGRIGYAEAGRRIDLTVTASTRLAMIGYADRVN